MVETSGHIHTARFKQGTSLQQIFSMIERYNPQDRPQSDALPHPLLGKFTPRQEEIIALVAKGLQNKEIAVALGISARTVQTHARNVYKRGQFRSRTQAALDWLRRVPRRG